MSVVILHEGFMPLTNALRKIHHSFPRLNLLSLIRIILISIFISLNVQFVFAINQLGAAPDPLGDFEFVRIPLKRAGNLVLIEAEVEGQIGYFILDTGAPYLVLNETYFSSNHVIERRIMSDVAGIVDTVNVIEVAGLKLRSLEFGEMEADLVDLGSIENSRGVKILGLLGLNLFLQLEMRFDLRNQALELHRVDSKGKPLVKRPKCSKEKIELNFKMRNNVILMKMEINQNRLTFCFDTGAEAAVLANDLAEDVYSGVAIYGSRPLIGSSGRTVDVLYGKLTEIKIGEIPIKDCKVIIADLDEMGKAYEVDLDGMIGYDLLARGMVIINFKQRILTFCKS